MQIVIAILGSGVLSTIISGLFMLASQKKKKSSALEDGVQKLLYERIKFLARRFIAESEISGEDLEDLIAMHESYHNLGGNGFLDKLMQQVKSLPIK